MVELKAYSVKLRKMVDIKDPELVTLKNGRKAVRGFAADDPTVRSSESLMTNKRKSSEGR